MKIESLELQKVLKENSRMRARGSITLSNGWIIEDLRIIEGEDGLFIAFPTPKNIDEERFLEVINKEVRVMIQNTVLSKYNKL